MNTLLQLTGVAKSFGAVHALKGVSFDLRPGEIHALVGENGAGKSTLVKIITGAHRPDGGAIKLHGRKVDHLAPESARALGIACVYQQPALFPDLTVAENISLRLDGAALGRRVSLAKNRTRAAELLHRLGAEIDPGAEARSLSMPEQQLVEIACVLGSGSRVVVMDEPTASLTQKEQHLLFAVVRQLRADGVGVVYISHRLEEVVALADRVTVLRDGESVGTMKAGEMSEAGLIRLMVGREISHLYPEREGATGAPVLALNRVGCAAGGVRDVTLEIRAGEVLGLAGLVGAGRTELARVVFGITPADAGEIQVAGGVVRISSPSEAIAHGIAYVPEDRRRQGVILEMSVAANISLAVHHRIFPGGWLRFGVERRLADDFIGALGIKTSGPAAPAGFLSGGNQQKVSLVRWLATKPKLLILDEPTQGVDVGAKSEIHKLIRRLAGEGLAVLMISSDLPEVLGMSDRIAVMRGGAVTAMLSNKASAHEVMAAALGREESVTAA